MNEGPERGEGAQPARAAPAGPADPRAPGREGRARPRWLAGTVLAAALLALAIGIWLWRRPLRPELPPVDLAGIDPEIVEAVTAAQRQVLRKPRSGSAWGRLGMVLRAHDFDVPANRCLAQAERLDPEEPRWPYLQAQTLLLSDPDGGIACLERAVERCQDTPLAPRLRLAEALLDTGRLDQAELHLQQALARDPDNARTHLDLGRLAILRQDWRKALEHLTRCVADANARRFALLLRAQVYRRLGERAQADADESQAEKLPEHEAWPDQFLDEVWHLQRGLEARLVSAERLRRDGRLDQAIPILEDTAQKYPTSFLPGLRLSELWHRLGREDRAEAACRQALRADPDAAQVWFWLGCLQVLKGPHEAADSFRRTLRLKPDHAGAHFNLACCLRQTGDLAGAAEEFRRALRCRPDLARARTALKELEGKVPPRTKGAEEPAQ